MHRALLLRTADGVRDQDARRRRTVSELSLGGLIEHVAHTEGTWAAFVDEGAPATGEFGAEALQTPAASFQR